MFDIIDCSEKYFSKKYNIKCILSRNDVNSVNKKGGTYLKASSNVYKLFKLFCMVVNVK